MAVFMVERDLKGIDMKALGGAQNAAISKAEEMRGNGSEVRYIRTTFAPDDGRCMCLFEAGSKDEVKRLNEEASLPYHRIVSAMDLTPRPEYIAAPANPKEATTQDSRRFPRAYFEALAAQDMSGVPYAEDAILWAPLGPDGLEKPIEGREAILRYFENVFPVLGRVEIQNLFSDGEWACGRAFIHLTQPAGAKLRVNDVFRIKDGRIVEQENHYDPRPALG